MASRDQSEIARTQARSASLTRELRLTDLVFLQILLIVGLPWIGYAARLGGAHFALWLLAILLFSFPLAATVTFLSRRLPLEGGVYQWVKLGISPFAGFQAAWNYAFFLILIYAASGSVVANSLSYVAGPRAAWMSSSKPVILACSLVFFALVYLVNYRGLHLARWVPSAGGALGGWGHRRGRGSGGDALFAHHRAAGAAAGARPGHSATGLRAGLAGA